MNDSLKPSTPAIRVSVSQVKKYKRCARSWWYKYGPLGIKPPAPPAAGLGSAVHHILEDYLLQGTEPPATKAGRIASCGLDKLPNPDELEIEKSITLPLAENSKILCRIDMLGKDRPYVGDHKTTSDFKWAKTRGELNTDVQLLTYAYAAYHESQPAEVDAELIYYRTRGLPVSMSVSTVLKWEDIEKNWALMGEIAEEMAPKKLDPTGDTCAPNTGACNDFGGCFFAGECPFSPRNRKNSDSGLAKVTSRDNNRGASDDAKTKTKTKKGKLKMSKKSKDIQAAFGILSPDAVSSAALKQTTRSLIEAKAKAKKADPKAEAVEKLIEMLNLFGGKIPGETVMSFLKTKGIDEKHWRDVLEAAGAEIDSEGNIMQPTKETTPKASPKGAEIFAPKRCTVDTLKQVAHDMRKKIVDAGGMAESDVREKFEAEIAPSTPTASRWNRFVSFMELENDGGWFKEGNPEGYTVIVPESEKSGAELDREAYEVKTGKPAPAPDDERGTVKEKIAHFKTAHFSPLHLREIRGQFIEMSRGGTAEGIRGEYYKNAPDTYFQSVCDGMGWNWEKKAEIAPREVVSQVNALAGHLIVMVDALFGAGSPSNAISFNLWVAPYIAAVEDLPAAQGRDFYTLDADYAKGSKFLCGVLAAAFKQDKPEGLILADSGNGTFRSVLPILEQAGAVVIYGRR